MENKISIITAVYNGEQLLPRLIESVKQQSYPNKELIIIDGGSIDGTLDVIRRYENVISYWISEPDDGIYDAWNKGIENSTGDWIMFLGCDDILLPGALDMYIRFLNSTQESKEINLIHSKGKTIDKYGETIRITGWEHQWPLFLKEMTIEHVGALHAKKFFKSYGKFDTEYKIVGDYELLLRPGKELKTAFMNEVTVLVTEGGVSESISAIKEHYKAVTTTGGYSSFKAFINALFVSIKFKVKRIFKYLGLNLYLKSAG